MVQLLSKSMILTQKQVNLKKGTTTLKGEIVNLKKTIEDQKSKLAALDNEQDLMRKTGQEKEDKLLQLNISLQKTNKELKSEFDVILSKQKTEITAKDDVIKTLQRRGLEDKTKVEDILEKHKKEKTAKEDIIKALQKQGFEDKIEITDILAKQKTEITAKDDAIRKLQDIINEEKRYTGLKNYMLKKSI